MNTSVRLRVGKTARIYARDMTRKWADGLAGKGVIDLPWSGKSFVATQPYQRAFRDSTLEENDRDDYCQKVRRVI